MQPSDFIYLFIIVIIIIIIIIIIMIRTLTELYTHLLILPYLQ